MLPSFYAWQVRWLERHGSFWNFPLLLGYVGIVSRRGCCSAVVRDGEGDEETEAEVTVENDRSLQNKVRDSDTEIPTDLNAWAKGDVESVL